MSIYEWLSIILGILNLASIVFLATQLLLSKKQAEDLHEEQRRIKTLDVLTTWSNSIKMETRLAEKIVENLNIQQCKDLYNYTPFHVNSKIYKMVCSMCTKFEPESENCKKCKSNNCISGDQLTELRGHITNYLNNLEIVAISWQQAIVDKEVIETQFSFLYTPGTKSAVENYRKVAGNGSSYPVLEMFYEQIKKNSSLTNFNEKNELNHKKPKNKKRFKVKKVDSGR